MSDWPHFSEDELRCSHTGECHMDPLFMERLEGLRIAFGMPMRLSSAYRHPTHPVEASKDKPGAHSTGCAVDVLVHGREAHRLLKLAMQHGFTGIGIKQKGVHEARFIHLDTLSADDAFRPTVWSY